MASVLYLVRQTGAVVNEGSDLVFYRRLYADVSGTQTALTQALTTSISYSVYDSPTTTTASATGTLTVSSVIFDTLQTWSIWTTYLDSTGGNFRTTMAKSLFPDAKQYRVEFLVTLSGGNTFTFDYLVDVRDLQSQ
jgi:hypothetical protein